MGEVLFGPPIYIYTHTHTYIYIQKLCHVSALVRVLQYVRIHILYVCMYIYCFIPDHLQTISLRKLTRKLCHVSDPVRVLPNIIHTHTNTHIRIYIHTYIRIYIHNTHTHTHTHTHTQTLSLSLSLSSPFLGGGVTLRRLEERERDSWPDAADGPYWPDSARPVRREAAWCVFRV
jgi:hypothetical protein